jgi:hypothetical protein
MIARRLWPVGLLAALLLTQALAPSGALGDSPATLGAGSAPLARTAVRGASTQVIDARANPQAAAAALDSGCTDLSNCSWSGSTITFDYGPSKIYGNVLYNCADPVTEPGAIAYTAAGFTETRSESVSLTEGVSLKISLGFLGLEKTSAEFTATFGQSSSFSEDVMWNNGVEVPPGYKGWTETQVLSGNVTGTASIADGIGNLIQVKNLGMSFPLTDPAQEGDPNDGRSLMIPNSFTAPMSMGDMSTRCDPINGLGAASRRPRTGSLKLTLCSVTPASRRARCTTRTVTDAPAPRKRLATAVLTRGGRTDATGTDTNGHIRLTTRRPITAGHYTLTLRAPQTTAQKARHWTLSTIIPITIR